MSIVKLTQDIILPASVAQNVFWLTASPDLGLADQSQVISDLTAWLQAMYGEINVGISNLVTYGTARVDLVDPLTNDEEFYVDFVPSIGPGTATSDMAPSGVSAQINGLVLGTATGPKKFIAGMNESSVLTDTMQAAMLAAMVEFGADWIAGPVDSSITWVSGMWSRTKKQFFGLIAAEAVATAAYQRRRKPGVGM